MAAPPDTPVSKPPARPGSTATSLSSGRSTTAEPLATSGLSATVDTGWWMSRYWIRCTLAGSVRVAGPMGVPAACDRGAGRSASRLRWTGMGGEPSGGVDGTEAAGPDAVAVVGDAAAAGDAELSGDSDVTGPAELADDVAISRAAAGGNTPWSSGAIWRATTNSGPADRLGPAAEAAGVESRATGSRS